MRRTLATRLLRLLPVFATVLFILGDSKPASAVMCFQDLRTCYYQASAATDWWSVWMTGLDCELDFTDCARRAIIGR